MKPARTERRRPRIHAFAGLVLAGALLLTVGTASSLRGQPTGSQVRGQDDCGCDEDAVAEYNRQLEEWMSRQIERVRAASFPSPAPAADPSGIAPVVSGEMETRIREGVSNLDTTLRDPRGTAMTGSTVAGLVMIRDVYVDKLRELADRFEALAEAGMADQRDRVRELVPKAEELRRLELEIRNLNVMIPDRPISGPEDHAEWNRERMRKQDEARARFNEVLGSCPELSVPHDGQDLWDALNDVPTRGRSALEVELDQRRVLEEYLRSGAEQLRDLADEAEQKDTIDELMEFGGPMYEEIREAVAMQGDLAGSDLPRSIMEQVELIVRAYDIHAGVDEGWWRVGLATVAVLAIPISPVLCLGVAAVDVVVTGGELVITYLDAEEARAARPATGAAGQRYMVTAEDRRNAAAGDFVLAVVGLGLDASAVRAVKVRGLEPRPCPDPVQPRVLTGGEEAGDTGRVVTGGGDPPDAPPPTGRPPADEVPPRPRTGDGETPSRTDTESPEAVAETPPAGDRTEEMTDAYDAEDLARIERERERTGQAGADRGEWLTEDGRPATIDDLRRERRAGGYETVEDLAEDARAAGVPEETIGEITGGLSESSDELATRIAGMRLENAILEAKGYTLGAADDLPELIGIYTRSRNRGGLSPEDYDALRRRVEEDPSYLDDLDRRSKDVVDESGNPTGLQEALLPPGVVEDLRRWYDEGPVGDEVARAPPTGPEGVAPADPPVDDVPTRTGGEGRARGPGDTQRLGEDEVLQTGPDDDTVRLPERALEEPRGPGDTQRLGEDEVLQTGPDDDTVRLPERALEEPRGPGDTQRLGEDEVLQTGPDDDTVRLPERALEEPRGPGDTQRLTGDEIEESALEAETVRVEGARPPDEARTGARTGETGDEVEATTGPRIERVETVSGGKRWGHLGDATVDEAFGHPDIPDDAWVHFGGSGIADGVRTGGVRGHGDRSYWARWGEVKNMTQGELRWKIGESTVSGQSDLRTLVVAPPDARIRTVPGNYGFEVEGVADGTVEAGRVVVAPPDTPARPTTGRVADDAGNAADERTRTDDARDAARAGVRGEEIRRAGDGEEGREETDRVERAEPPPGDARPETGGEAEDGEERDDVRRVSDARTGDPDAAGPTGGGGGGTAVAMSSVPGEVVEPVEPIEFEIWPRGFPEDLPSTTIDTATLINSAMPDAIRTGGRDPTVQLVILDGPETFSIPPTDGAVPETRRIPGGAAIFDPDLLLHVVSEGGLGADAMRMIGFNGRDLPVSFDGGSLVVEPVDVEEEVRERIENEIRDLAGDNPWTATLHAYCVEYLREPPTPGSVFRMASEDLQQRFAPLGDVLRAGRELHARGLLNPDSDPGEYFHSIRQWAVWTFEERLDRAGFERGFLEHVKRNFNESGQAWTEEAETLVRGLVPNRWNDVQRILDAVREPERTEGR